MPYSFDVLNLLLIHKKINYSCVVIKDLQVCYRHEQFVWRMTVIIKLPCTDVHSSSYNVLLFKQSAKHYSYIDCFVVEYGLMVVIFRSINPKSHREIVKPLSYSQREMWKLRHFTKVRKFWCFIEIYNICTVVLLLI